MFFFPFLQPAKIEEGVVVNKNITCLHEKSLLAGFKRGVSDTTSQSLVKKRKPANASGIEQFL